MQLVRTALLAAALPRRLMLRRLGRLGLLPLLEAAPTDPLDMTLLVAIIAYAVTEPTVLGSVTPSTAVALCLQAALSRCRTRF